MMQKIVHFTFYIYFTGALGATMFFGGHEGATPKHAPVRSGAERVRKLNERERSVKKYGGAGAERERSGSGAGAGRSRSRERGLQKEV